MPPAQSPEHAPEPKRAAAARWLFALLVVLALWRFVGLDDFDLEKDGALWALRAKACALHGDWWDQTPHAIGGLHTSAYPPLHVWATGLSYKLFGINGFAARLPSALSGLVLVAAVTALGWLIAGPYAGLFAGILIAGNRDILAFSQNGQLEATYLAWNVVAILAYAARARFRSGRAGLSAVCLVITGVAFGLALMSKIATGFLVGLMLIPWGLYLWYARQARFWRDLVLDAVVVIAIGLAIAAPWHVSMLLKYRSGPGLFTDNAFVEMFWKYHILARSATPIEGHHDEGWGALFYVNAGLKAMPYIAACAIAGFVSCVKNAVRRRPIAMETCLRALPVICFIVNFVVLTRPATKMLSYAVVLIPPAALLAGVFLRDLILGPRRRRVTFFVLAGTFVAIIYAHSNPLHRAIPEFLAGRAGPLDIRSVLLFLIEGVGAFLLAAALVYPFAKRVRVREAALLALLILVPLTLGALAQPFRHESDWSGIEPHIGRVKPLESVLVLGKWRDNRQIDYYLDGADMGFHPDMLFVHIQMTTSNRVDRIEGWTVRDGVRTHMLLDSDEAADLVQEALGEGPMIALVFDEHKLPKAVTSPATSSLKQTARSGRITLWRNDQHGGTQSD